MNLGELWYWEKVKLTANIDLSANVLSDGSTADGVPDSEAPAKKSKNKGGRQGTVGKRLSSSRSTSSMSKTASADLSLSIANRNLNKQHLTPVKKLPYRRRLDKKLDSIKVPERLTQSFPTATLKPTQKRQHARRVRKLESLKPEMNSVQPMQIHSGDHHGDLTLAEKPYCGDLFGTRGNYIEGMVYRSRMKDKAMLRNMMREQPVTDAIEAQDLVEEVVNEEVEVPPVAQGEEKDGSSGSDNDDEMPDKFEAKQRCAATLRNWSFHDENRQRMVKEGAVQALMKLAIVDDKKTRTYCATAFRNLAARPELRQQIVSAGAVHTIVEMCNNTCLEISKDCATALCHLSCMPGCEPRLVDDGAVPTLMMLMSEFKEVAPICARALFNLTCVQVVYDTIHRVIKAFIGLGSSANITLETKQICVSALCNLSNLSRVHARMVDDGVVQAVVTLARGSDNRTKRLCAVVLQNLSSARGCRSEMVKKGAVQVLILLADTEDAERQHWCAAALNKLVQDKASRVRIVEEGAVSALSTISKSADQRGDNPQTTRLCANALLTLSSFEDSKQLVVDRGAVPVLIQLAKSPDVTTKQLCTLGLCSLLSLQDSAIYIMQQGAVSALVQLSNTENEDTRASCASVLYNLSCSEETGQLVVKEGFVPAILTLSKAKKQDTKARCAATLGNLASIEANRRRMVDERVVPCLVSLMQSAHEEGDVVCVRDCTAALCSLSHDQANTAEIVKDVTVMKAIAQARWEGEETQKSMCTVLANLTFLEASRSSLAELGAIPSLIELSKLDDDATRHRCAVAFCNLSCAPSIRANMVEEGVVGVLAELSNSYSEENQQDCAKALCNLSCHEGTEARIVREGAVAAIMMIAMVRAVSPQTKQTCSKALLNLLNAESLPLMVEEGLVQALASLARLAISEETMNTCAKAFCILSSSDIGRKAVCAKRATLVALFGLMKMSQNVETQTVCGKTVINLLQDDNSREAAVAAGVITLLTMLAKVPNEESECNSADALFIVSCFPSSRDEILRKNALPVLVRLGQSENCNAWLSCARALCHLAWHRSTRQKLAKAGALPALVSLATSPKSSSRSVYEPVAQALCYLSLHDPDDSKNACRCAMVQQGVMKALITLYERTNDDDMEIRRLLALTVAGLSWAKGQESQIVDDGGIELLNRLTAVAAESRVGDVLLNCAVAYCNLSFVSELREKILDQNAVPSIQHLASASHLETNWRCAATLRFLALFQNNRRKLVDCGCVSSLVGMCSREGAKPETLRDCAAALCSLSKSKTGRSRIVQEGAVPLLIKLSNSDMAETTKSCSVALSNLSTASASVDEGTVSALISMSLTGEGEDAHLHTAELNNAATTVLEEDSKPPTLPVQPGELDAPTMTTLQEVYNIKVVKAEKQSAGMAGKGPETNPPPLMEPTIMMRTAAGAGLGEEDDSTDIHFPKMELSLQMEREMNNSTRPTYLFSLNDSADDGRTSMTTTNSAKMMAALVEDSRDRGKAVAAAVADETE